ncbi:hypothetical protein H632_c4992p0, partial [Helicosporidium sp. ATCC 50920]
MLEWVGAVPDKTLWRKKEVRVNTRLCYNQRKFNLLREESEGYAKLATLLGQRGRGGLRPEFEGALVLEVRALIGFFDLDPARACSAVLAAAAQAPRNPCWPGVLRTFQSECVAQMLGLAFERLDEGCGDDWEEG